MLPKPGGSWRPSLPDWAGVGDPDLGYFAGLPGKIYANVLEEVWTGISPTIAYWNPFTTLSDNRIKPFETALSDYIFEYLPEEVLRIEIQLVFRRTLINVMDWKQWDTPDILIDEITLYIGND